MVLSYTVSRERLFAPLRERLGGRDTWLGYLVSCPFCASWWISFAVVPLTGAYFIEVPHEWGLVSDAAEWFLSSALVTALAAFLRVGFFVVDETQGFVRRRAKTEEIEREVLERRVHDQDDKGGIRLQ